jgi:hypothetical protein
VLLRLSSLAWLVFITVLAGAARGDTVTLNPIRDNTLFEDADGDTSNGAGTGIFCGRMSQGRIRRALIMFDLTGALPAEAVIDTAKLELHMNSSSDPFPRLIRVHRVLADWGEGASASAGGGGAPAQPGDATWLHRFYPTSFWSSPGGDFIAGPSDTLTVAGEGDYVWTSEALADDVRGWVSQATGSFGWVLLGDEMVSNTARRFESRESATSSFRPRLVLHYSIPTAVRATTWGEIKSKYR